MSNALILQLLYLAASVLFIMGLKALSSPKSARRGMGYAALGMLLAVVGTLFHHGILTYEWIVAGFIIGSLIGGAMAIFMPMTAMPQRIALSHAFGALAAVLVGVVEFMHKMHQIEIGEVSEISRGWMAAIGFEVLFGSLTITGSFMAFGKLQEIIHGPPITYKFQNISNISLFVITLGMFIYLVVDPSATPVVFLSHDRPGPVDRRVDGHAHRRGRHAGGHLAAELLRGSGRRGHGLRHRQQGVDHRRLARRLLGLLPFDPHEPGHEPLLRQRALRGRGRSEVGGRRRRRNRKPSSATRRKTPWRFWRTRSR